MPVGHPRIPRRGSAPPGRDKQFYQRFCEQETASGGDLIESNKLVWRRHCSLCCADKPCPNKDDPTLTHHRLGQPTHDNNKGVNNTKRITLNANIEPFAPFTIHHDGVYSSIDCENRLIGSLMSWPFNEDTRSEDPDKENGSCIDVRGGNGIRTFPSFSGRRGSQQGTGHICQLRGSNIPSENNLTQSRSSEVCTRGIKQKPINSQKTNGDGDVVHYATSTINSEDGVESHLEVSLGRDGDTVIKTSHKLLVHSASHSNIGKDAFGNPEQATTLSNSSVLRLKYAADGKTLNISSSQKLLPNPTNVKQQSPAVTNCLNPGSYMSMLRSTHPRPSSAYYTQQCPINPRPEFPERYNSLPNLYGRQIHQLSDSASSLMYDGTSGSPWVYQTYPADEEKRVAYTRSEKLKMLSNFMLRATLNLKPHF